eukprot:SAG11_NODE_932_length_6489_cov_6.539039_3_plen_97_part_00
MVAKCDDGGRFSQFERIELVKKLADVVVGVRDRCVVAAAEIARARLVARAVEADREAVDVSREMPRGVWHSDWRIRVVGQRDVGEVIWEVLEELCR